MVLASIVFLLPGCSEKPPGFYDHAHTWDLSRLPLIAPYQLTSADKGNTWTLEFRGTPPLSTLGSGAIDSLAVIDSIIVLYNPSYSHVHEGQGKAWFIIDSRTKHERIVADRRLLVRILDSMSIRLDSLYPIRPIFDRFESEGVLPWRETRSMWNRG